MSTELLAAIELLKMLLLDPKTVVLIALLGAAAWFDLRTRRIPNAIVLAGLLFAIFANGLFPAYVHENGWTKSLQGMLVGFGCFLPFYLIRAMGAGDVKLMAMAGAFLGPLGALHAVLASLIAGGVLAIATMVTARASGRVLRNMALAIRGAALAPQLGLSALTATTGSAGNTPLALPYGLAIASGTTVYLVLKQLALI